MSELKVGNFEKVASGIYLEGLAVDYKRNIVWFSDVIAGGIHGLMPGGSVESFNPQRMWTGGIMLNEDGAILSSGPGGIMWNNPESGKSGWLIREIYGEVINGVNEMMPDGQGGIFFGTSDIEMVERGQPTRPTAIYHFSQDRQLTRLADGIGFSNGIMYDARRNRFYCNDTFTCSWAFDVGPDFALVNKTVLLDKEDADGMALDADGNVWITGFRSNFLARLSPDGQPLPRVSTPAGAVTQIRFGGNDMRDYYINAVPADGGDSLKDGEIPTEKNSIMYKGRSETPGLPIEPARFALD